MALTQFSSTAGYYHGVLAATVLCDSGSQVSAFPPEPGDVPMPDLFLKAANGSRMSCFGHKVMSVRIGPILMTKRQRHFETVSIHRLEGR